MPRLTRESMLRPIETWAQVVYKPPSKNKQVEHPAPLAWNVLFGIRLSDFSGEICGLLKVRSLCFEP